MSPFRDYYEILGIDPSATRDEIKRAYRQRALEAHPDLHQDLSNQQNEEMRLLNEAYKTLSYPSKRAGYDIEWNNYYRQRGLSSGGRSSADVVRRSFDSATARPARAPARFGAVDVFLLVFLIVLSIILGAMIAGRVRQRFGPGPPPFPPASPAPPLRDMAIHPLGWIVRLQILDEENAIPIPEPFRHPLDV